MKYKLICLDMDGTLLSDEKKISERNLKAIKAAYEKGVRIAVCTGRLFTSADYYANLIGVKTPVISSNGAYIREKDNNEVIYKSILGVENCNIILDVLKKNNIVPHFNTSQKVLTEKIIYSSKAYADANKDLPKDRQISIEIVKDWEETFMKYKDEVLKCIEIDEDIEKINRVKQEMIDLDRFEVVSSWKNNFEIMSKGVSKGRGVEILAGFYGINREEVVCFGDSENDLSMIEYAGTGVAMGNGEPYVKKAADYVTDTNNNHGIAKFIEKYILT